MQRTRPTIQRKQRIPASLILRHVDKPGQQCDSKQVQVINSVKKWASVNIPTTSEQAMSVGTSLPRYITRGTKYNKRFYNT